MVGVLFPVNWSLPDCATVPQEVSSTFGAKSRIVAARDVLGPARCLVYHTGKSMNWKLSTFATTTMILTGPRRKCREGPFLSSATPTTTASPMVWPKWRGTRRGQTRRRSERRLAFVPGLPMKLRLRTICGRPFCGCILAILQPTFSLYKSRASLTASASQGEIVGRVDDSSLYPQLLRPSCASDLVATVPKAKTLFKNVASPGWPSLDCAPLRSRPVPDRLRMNQTSIDCHYVALVLLLVFCVPTLSTAHRIA
jgi:hypothetical protein